MINKTVTVEWEGVSYTAQVTMRLRNRIENDVNLLDLAMKLNAGGVPPMSHIATVFHQVLSAGGCTRTDEEIFEALFENTDAIGDVLAQIIPAFFPEVKETIGDQPKKPKTLAKRSRGKTSTKS
jgi:hypothetical protein